MSDSDVQQQQRAPASRSAPHDALHATFHGVLGPDGLPVEFVAGVPARNLTGADWVTLSDEERASVAASPLYRLVEGAAEPDALRGLAGPVPAEPVAPAKPKRSHHKKREG